MLDLDSNKTTAEIEKEIKSDGREHLNDDQIIDDTEELLLSFQHVTVIKVVLKNTF